MVKEISFSSGVSILWPRARLLRIFGDELISSKTDTVPIVMVEVSAQFPHILREVHT